MANTITSGIKNIFKRRKPLFWIILVSAAFVLAVDGWMLASLIRSFFLKPMDLILPPENEAEIKQSSQENKDFFITNQERLERIALYLENTQDPFGTGPIAFYITSANLIDKISDPAIRQEIQVLLQQRKVACIVSRLEDGHVQFVMEADFIEHGYEQGFYHVAADYQDTFEGENNQIRFDQLRRYEKLADHWYEYIYTHAEVKNADRYRKAAWKQLGAERQKEVKTHWSDARITLIAGEDFYPEIDKADQVFVVCVEFTYKNSDMFGSIALYFDPVTLKPLRTGGVIQDEAMMLCRISYE